MDWQIGILSGILGLFIGSFLNVCIHRIPRRESIAFPPSHCPACRKPIRFYDNIPVLSYFLLRGRCRSCRARISVRYPVVEALTGILFLLLAVKFGWSWQLARGLALAGLLVAITFIDLDRQIIPDVISLPGIVVGLASGFLVPGATDAQQNIFVPALIAALVGAGFIFAAGWGWKAATRREGMGGGDVKLAAMMGAFLGDWRLVLLAIFIGVVLGVVGGLGVSALTHRSARKPIPFGPFLAAGTMLVLFFGSQLLEWYLGFFVGR